MINTITGSIKEILTGNDLDGVDSFNKILISNKNNITKEKELVNIEIYILKLILSLKSWKYNEYLITYII